MKNGNDILKKNIIKNDFNYTGISNKPSKTLPKLVDNFQNETFDEILDSSDDLQGEGIKVFIPSNINDIHSRLEVLLGLKLSGHTDTLTEASNWMDEF